MYTKHSFGHSFPPVGQFMFYSILLFLLPIEIWLGKSVRKEEFYSDLFLPNIKRENKYTNVEV